MSGSLLVAWLAPYAARMDRAIEALERDLRRVQTGRASATLVESLQVDHRGARLPLGAMASISVPDPRQLLIEPWDPSAVLAIAKAIAHSSLGVAPQIGGGALRLYVPALSAERREELVHAVEDRGRQAQVDIRAIRHEALAAVRPRGRAVGGDEAARELKRLERLVEAGNARIGAAVAARAAELRRM